MRIAISRRLPSLAEAREYLASDSARAVQVVLGLFWLIDGGLQFQPFMYSPGWVQQLASMQAGQPQWLASSIAWGAGLAGANLPVWNTAFALTQVAIGLGLLYRRTTKPALAGSLAWAAIVWWLGEAFGMLFMSTASPLAGAPGAVVLYALIALVAWPNGRVGGLLGDRGTRVTWAVLWAVMGWLWLLPANSGSNSVSNAIASVPTGIGWLTTALAHVVQVTQGRGEVIALVCGGLSVLIGCAVGFRRHARAFLWTAIVLNILYWVVGQGFGGIATGNATDVDTAPLFILLACALFTLFPKPAQSPAAGAPSAVSEARDASGKGRRLEAQRPPAAALSRRAVVTTAGAAAGAAFLVGCGGLFARGNSGGQSPVGSPGDGHNGQHNSQHNSQHDEQHGNGHGNANGNGQNPGGWDNGDPNAGIVMLSSQITLPAQFRSPLPIPGQLKPTRQTADTDYYEIVQSQATAGIIPGLRTPIWGYNGTFPGPTIVQNPGRRVVVTHRNALPVPTVVHLHGGTTPHDSDGYPTDFVLPAASYGSFPLMPAMAGMPAMTDPDAITTRLTRDYTYPPQPRAATLWYHDHRMGFTGPSVYRGLAGFHIARDAEEQALPLPQGTRDVPLMITDRAFAADGSFLYPALDPALRSVPGVAEESMKGVMGDVILVNGAPWPVMKVDTARYRFRILNASNARTYQLALDDPSQGNGLIQIGTDHGLLAAPFPQDSITISPAQRFDVVIDFSRHKPGDQVTLVNQLGSGSVAAVMRFAVTRATSDNSSIPATLSPAGTITPDPAMTQRTIKFHRGADDWTINGQVFDPGSSQADVPAGSTELWTITSDFHHPFHIHNATAQVVARDGQAPGPSDHGWKDTVFVNQGESVQLAIRFANYQGRYVFHCHNLEHEDMGMMANFRIT
jgi:spore coat protein A, manganese oxidase